MNFWAVSSMPVHRLEDKRMKKKVGTMSPVPSRPPPSPGASRSPAVAMLGHQDHVDMHDLAATHGLGKRVKSAAALQKKHQSYSSGSSLSADGKSWEHTLETLSLSRKSSASGRSSSSGMPTRERPESVPIFGKTIFNRRKMRRDSSTQSSSPARGSGSSLSSADEQGDLGHVSPKESQPSTSIMPTIFGRRRNPRGLRISEPYNFQHTCGLRGLQDRKVQDVPLAGFSTETLPLRDEVGTVAAPGPSRIPPPRPPRSPVESCFPGPPVPPPPPRVSSHASVRHEDADTRFELERRWTSIQVPEARYPRVLSSDDVNWPLPCPSHVAREGALPNVPEEDENALVMRSARPASNHSSLRGSQSVPVLRKLPQPHEKGHHRRRSSGASETLGRSEPHAVHRHLETVMQESSDTEILRRESWEDDIDYCYDHAVEADCDYAWERPSLDLVREEEELQLAEVLASPVTCGVALSPGLPLPSFSPQPDAAQDGWRRWWRNSPSTQASSVAHDDEPTVASSYAGSSQYERHASTVSCGTDWTRLTSTSSLDSTEASGHKDELMTAAQERDTFVLGHAWADARSCAMPPLPEHEPTAFSSSSRAAFGSEPNLLRWAAEQEQKQLHLHLHRPRKESLSMLPTRRPRARTTSLSSPPPVGQYAVFPSMHARGLGV